MKQFLAFLSKFGTVTDRFFILEGGIGLTPFIRFIRMFSKSVNKADCSIQCQMLKSAEKLQVRV